jgi:biopolymer transport protein ExbD
VNIVKNKEDLDVTGAIDIAPLIDCVFLLLIYFMVTASVVKKEGDISFVLPATVAQQEMVTVPVEVLIEVDAEGMVVLEGLQFPPEDRMLNDLAMQIRGLKQVAVSQNAPFFVNILPHRETKHQRIVDVMDACAAARVDSLTFSKSL